MPMLCFRLCPNKLPFPGCSLWMLIFPVNLSHQSQHIVFCSSRALGGSFLTAASHHHGQGGREKNLKTPPVWKGCNSQPRCGGSESSWLFLGGFSSSFLFSLGWVTTTSPGEARTGLSVAADVIPLCLPSTAQEPQSPWHCFCWEPEEPPAAQRHPGHWHTSPHCSAGWSCPREIWERRQKQSERMEKQHNQTWLK